MPSSISSILSIPKDASGIEVVRGECTLCTVCRGFLSDGTYLCSCHHRWHSHQPTASEQAALPVRYRRGANSDVFCTSYYPTEVPTNQNTPCYCGGLPVAHEPLSILIVNPQPPPARFVSPPPPPSPSQLNAPSGTRPRYVDMMGPAPTIPGTSAGQRRAAEASIQFHAGVPLTARSNAPQPSTSSAGRPATSLVTQPRLGYSGAPTTQTIPGTPSVSTLLGSEERPARFILAVLPIKFVEPPSGSTRILPTAARRLKNKVDDLIDRLGDYGLLVSYVASPDPVHRKGHALIRHLHDAITGHLFKMRYHLPGTSEVPDQPAELQYTDLPWRIVWYPSKPAKLHILSEEDEKLSIPSLNSKTFERTPFGRGATRPQIKGDKRPLIMIMPRFDNLMGLMPTSDGPRGSLVISEYKLHRCMGRRVMDGFYSDERPSSPSNLECRPFCEVPCDPQTLLPISVSPTTSPAPSLPSPSSEGNSVLDDIPVPTEPPGTATGRVTVVTSRIRAVVAGPPQVQTTSVPPVVRPAANISATLNGSSNAARGATGLSLALGMPTRVRNRPASMEIEQPQALRRRINSPSRDEAEAVEAPPQISSYTLFPAAQLPGAPTMPTMIGDQNIAEEFVREVSLHVDPIPEIRLQARNEKVAAAAIYNFILKEANRRYNADVSFEVVNEREYRWRSEVPTTYRALFKKDFNLILTHPDPLFTTETGLTFGNAPKIATIRGVLDLVVDNPALFSQKGNLYGYQDANITNLGIDDPSKQALMWLAGCVSALHIVRTLTGPYPISPFLLYLSLEKDFTRFVNKDFVQHFDTAAGVEFFDLLEKVEQRMKTGATPYLAPFKHHYMEIHGGEITHIESDAVRQNPQLLQQLVVSMLGGALGVRGFLGRHTSPDFSAFQSGFRDCLDDELEVSSMLWPNARQTREFMALLYNRQPQHPDDVLNRIQFVSCGKPEYELMEIQVEKGIRDYVRGVGIPPLARWAGDSYTKRVDFNRPAGRATQVLLSMTSSDLMPATDTWGIQFKFEYSENNGLGDSTISAHTKALSINIHACFSEGIIDLPNPIMKLVSRTPELFEAVLHLIFTGKGFSGDHAV